MLKGTVIDVKKGQVIALVRLDIGGGVVVTASITNTAVEDLKLTIGQPAYAVIKSSDVIIAVD
jgi:molybdopterin-binding protein